MYLSGNLYKRTTYTYTWKYIACPCIIPFALLTVFPYTGIMLPCGQRKVCIILSRHVQPASWCTETVCLGMYSLPHDAQRLSVSACTACLMMHRDCLSWHVQPASWCTETVCLGMYGLPHDAQRLSVLACTACLMMHRECLSRLVWPASWYTGTASACTACFLMHRDCLCMYSLSPDAQGLSVCACTACLMMQRVSVSACIACLLMHRDCLSLHVQSASWYTGTVCLCMYCLFQDAHRWLQLAQGLWFIFAIVESLSPPALSLLVFAITFPPSASG